MNILGVQFGKKEEQITLPMPTKEELLSIAESLFQHGAGLPNAIENAIQKSIDAAQAYQAFEAMDDQGNYYGSEFNIRATAGRTKTAYTKEPWMFSSASLIARSLNTVPFVVRNKATKEVDKTHPLNSKILLGSRVSDNYTMNWNGGLDLVLGGNYFRVFNETFTECFQVPVEQVQIQLDQSRTFPEFIRVWDQAKSQTSRLIPYKQVVHHKYPNPSYPFYGLSLFIAASRPILLDRYKAEFEMAFYLRGATNAGVIETTEDINKTRMERLMRTFEQIYTGKRNWWRTIFLPKGAKWVQSGLTMSEMQHLEGMRENRLALLSVLGIPPSQVGIVQDVNRATAETQERAFWTNTIKPMALFIAAGWNNSYLVKTIYGGSVEIVPDFSEIEALQGSLITKGEQAKSVENYLFIDEIREDILGYPPLPNGAGQKFVAEIKGSGQPAQLALSAPNPVAQIVSDTEPNQLSIMKSQAVDSQERIERKLSKDYLDGYEKYIDEIISVAAYALREGHAPRSFIMSKSQHLAHTYMGAVESSLLSTLDRGFSFSSSQSKHFTRLNKMAMKRVRFNETDQQAIDQLREEQRDGQRETLVKRAVQNFVGFNETRTVEILDIIADGTEDGKTLDQIAATLRETYGEKYQNQASTIARTELLSAVSQGIKWNHDVLSEVFTDVQKQWLHVGDSESNPNARDWHADFEKEGPKPQDYKWGGILEYPRDPSAGAKEAINCRCSMISVIPDGATSNAEVILDRT